MGPRGYPASFRRKVRDLPADGESVASIAHDLDISDQTIYGWPRQDRIDRGWSWSHRRNRVHPEDDPFRCDRPAASASPRSGDAGQRDIARSPAPPHDGRMTSPGARGPVPPSRGVVLTAEFCQATGLDEAAVADMAGDGSIDGLVDQQGRLFGLFDDVLPSAAELRAKGHVVSDAYDPELFRSHEVVDLDDEPDDQGDAGPTWSMQWP
jgi:hypothetical protein